MKFLPRRLPLLLLALILPAVPWLLPADGPVAEVGAPPTAVQSPLEAGRATSVAPEARRPGLLPTDESPQRLPQNARTGAVLATAFPSDAGPAFPDLPSADGELPSLEADQSDQPEVSLKVRPSTAGQNEPSPSDSPADGPESSSSRWMSVTIGPADAPRQLSTPIEVVEEPESPQKLDPSEGSLLLPPNRSAQRSAQLERVARQADELIRHGFELASRGAYFAARAEFTRALRLIAQGLDGEHQTKRHSQCLAAGMTAMKEAGDFIPQGACIEADLDLAALIAGHRTPVLKSFDTEGLTPMAALKCYFTFAQEQLASAAGHEVAGSMGLHALGKLHAALATKGAANIRLAESKAMTFYQAALLACSQNHMAANDLGVLLARSGNYAEARTVLEHSLRVHPEATKWRNLALVYRSLGRVDLAERAAGHAMAARAAPKTQADGSTDQMVEWVDPNAFAATITRRQTARAPAPIRHPAAQTPAARQATAPVQSVPPQRVAPVRPAETTAARQPTAVPNVATSRQPPAPSRDQEKNDWASKLFSLFKKN